MNIKPLLSEKECGDTGVILESENTLFVAVIDVLGHGRKAYDVAIKAKEFLENNYKENLIDLMSELHYCISNPRGLAGSLIKLDIQDGQLSHVGIGNITTQIIGTTNYRFVARDGIVGYKMPTPRLHSIIMKKGDVLIAHSDGIRENNNLKSQPEILSLNAEEMSKRIIKEYSRGNDDTICFSLKHRDI